MNNLNLVKQNKRVNVLVAPVIEGHSHHWQLAPYERYISRGTCGCGAVWFFADNEDKRAQERVDLLNSKKSKEGKIMVMKDFSGPAEPAHPAVTEPVPAEVIPSHRRTSHSRQYLEDNKEAICNDYQRLKLKDFFLKWHLGAGIWTNLKRTWGVKGKQHRKSNSKNIAQPREQKQTHPDRGITTPELPPFPAFDKEWPVLTQIEWLKTYRELRTGARKE